MGTCQTLDGHNFFTNKDIKKEKKKKKKQKEKRNKN